VPGLEVREVPFLTAARAAEHFADFGIPGHGLCGQRRFHGCFGSHRDRAVILIDPNDPPDERRFTFAHELAHFLRDYLHPREQAAKRFGRDILQVLDGDRPPTAGERLAGALSGVPLGPHTHLLERDRWGRIVDPAAREAEDGADRLAFELLAPFDAVRADGLSDAALMARLASEFGLPGDAAKKYATILLG
jgi:hypothetical protein